MKRFYLLIITILSFYSTVIAQKTVNDFQFVSVPENYDFLHEKDQFQLNTYTKFLLNKYGFNAYMESELPNVRRCDGLYATMEGKPGFIYTKLTLILKDCMGNEIFRGNTGQSKEKVYERAYYEALRNAFVSVEALNAEQGELKISDDTPSEPKEINIQKVEDNPIDDEEPRIITGTGTKVNTVVKDKRVFVNGGKDFSLEETSEAFILKDLNDNEKIKGMIFKLSDGSYQFQDSSGNRFPANFNSEGDLIIKSSFSDLVFKRKN